MSVRKFFVAIALLTSFFVVSVCLAQPVDEKEEKVAEVKTIRKSAPTYRFAVRGATFFGWDSNADLATEKKGDTFEEYLVSGYFIKPWINDTKFTFDYDFDSLVYNERTDNSNILNHVRLGVHKKFAPVTIGAGADESFYYYPHNDNGDALFHKGFFYVRQNIFKNLYHRLMFEAGLKDFTHAKALNETIDTYQDSHRIDRRWSAEYTVGSNVAKKLNLTFRTKFSLNDSNAHYLDFYDYKSYQETLSAEYRLLKRLYLNSSFSFIHKDYLERTIALGTGKQRDNLCVASVGPTYYINKYNSLSLYYVYRNNSSNEDLDKYMEHMLTAGWQINF